MSNQHIQQPGKGVLFMNDRKTSEKHPDWKGTLTLSDGTPVKIAGWTKQTPKGSLISLAEDTFNLLINNNIQEKSIIRLTRMYLSNVID